MEKSCQISRNWLITLASTLLAANQIIRLRWQSFTINEWRADQIGVTNRNFRGTTQSAVNSSCAVTSREENSNWDWCWRCSWQSGRKSNQTPRQRRGEERTESMFPSHLMKKTRNNRFKERHRRWHRHVNMIKQHFILETLPLYFNNCTWQKNMTHHDPFYAGEEKNMYCACHSVALSDEDNFVFEVHVKFTSKNCFSILNQMKKKKKLLSAW